MAQPSGGYLGRVQLWPQPSPRPGVATLPHLPLSSIGEGPWLPSHPREAGSSEANPGPSARQAVSPLGNSSGTLSFQALQTPVLLGPHCPPWASGAQRRGSLLEDGQELTKAKDVFPEHPDGCGKRKIRVWIPVGALLAVCHPIPPFIQ